jgi:hypothetical protein
MNSTVSSPLPSQKTVVITFLADVHLNFFGMFVNVCASTPFCFQRSQMKARFITCSDVNEKFIVIFMISLMDVRA